jgi:hypothetical protein
MHSPVYQCIDCGGLHEKVYVDSLKPAYKIEQIYFLCGSVQTKIFSSRGQIGNAFNDGCQNDRRMPGAAGFSS